MSKDRNQILSEAGNRADLRPHQRKYTEAKKLWQDANNALKENQLATFYENMLKFAAHVKSKKLDMTVIRESLLNEKIGNPGLIGASNELFREIGLKASNSILAPTISTMGVALADFQNAKLPPNTRFDEAEKERAGIAQTIDVYKEIIATAEKLKTSELKDEEKNIIEEEKLINTMKFDYLNRYKKQFQSMDDLQHVISKTKIGEGIYFEEFMQLREQYKIKLEEASRPIKLTLLTLSDEELKQYQLPDGSLDIRKIIQNESKIFDSNELQLLKNTYDIAVNILEDTSKPIDERFIEAKLTAAKENAITINIDSLGDEKNSFAKELLTELIKRNEEKGIDRQVLFEQNKPYEVNINGEPYFIKLNKSMIARESKKNTEGRYEFYDKNTQSIYESPQSTVLRFEGVIKLNDDNKLTTKNYKIGEKSRLLKILPNRDEKARNDMLDHWGQVESKIKHLHVKAPFFTPDDLDPNLGTAYIVMNDIQGESLDKIIANNKLTEAEKDKLTYAILKALKREIHDRDLVHCDIKPANIIVNKKDNGEFEAHFIDIDDTKKANAKISKENAPAGTKPFLAPELLSNGNEHMSKKSDVFALGVVLTQLHTGNQEISNDNVADKINTLTNSETKKILHSMVEKNSENRSTVSQALLEQHDKMQREAKKNSYEQHKEMYIAMEINSILKFAKEPNKDIKIWLQIKKLDEKYSKDKGFIADSSKNAKFQDVMINKIVNKMNIIEPSQEAIKTYLSRPKGVIDKHIRPASEILSRKFDAFSDNLSTTFQRPKSTPPSKGTLPLGETAKPNNRLNETEKRNQEISRLKSIAEKVKRWSGKLEKEATKFLNSTIKDADQKPEDKKRHSLK